MGYSKWSVDKIDLVFIVFLLIISLSFVTFAVESVEYVTHDDFVLNTYGGLQPMNNYRVFSADLVPGRNYTLDIFFNYGDSNYSPNQVVYGFSNDSFASGMVLDDYTVIRSEWGSTYSVDFVADSTKIYFFIGASSYNASSFSPSYINLVNNSDGFSSAIDELYTQVSPVSLWEQFEFSLPFVLVVVLFGFGVFLIFGLIRKNSKGKMF